MKTSQVTKVLMSLLFSAFILTGMSFAQTPPPAAAPAAAPETMKPVHHERRADRHPELHKALRKLRGAKQDLQKAASDYGGHKLKAIAAIDQALLELHEALVSDATK